MEFLEYIGYTPPAEKPAELTQKQLSQIMDRYAVVHLSSEMIKTPKTGRLLEELVRRGLNEKARRFKARTREAKAWLYWKRFKMLDKKFLGVMGKKR